MRLLYLALPVSIHAHGMVTSPRSRNWVAHEDGVDFGGDAGVPPAEYCQHCLNRNARLCGAAGVHDYDAWLDVTGQAMPWVSQETYTAGSIIEIRTTLTTHHGGHFEVYVCARGRQATPDCMVPLEFVRDLTYGMPRDPLYPYRAYYPGWSSHQREHVTEFRLPLEVTGEEVLLQWRYITANSCSPPGYASYFQGANSENRVLPAGFWADKLRPCLEPYPLSGETATGWPEQFFNCAEISILPGTELTTLPPTAPDRTPAPTPAISRMAARQDNRLIAFLGNWQSCPSPEQLAQYSHVIIAFAVSYTWQPSGNLCSETCEIATPSVCNNAPNPQLIRDLQAANKKVLLSFGGAGMGGSWEGNENHCWEPCYSRVSQVVDRLVEICADLYLDGVDIDFEYDTTPEAMQFLAELTTGLRERLPPGSIVAHTPMDSDLVAESPYFTMLQQGVAEHLDFIMPQYFNGVTRPLTDGFSGTGAGQVAAASHYQDMLDTLFDGDVTKIIVGFCISDCEGTQSSANGVQAAQVMEEVGNIHYCHGGAFFWLAEHDINAEWSSAVNLVLEKDRGCSGGLVSIDPSAKAPGISDENPVAPMLPPPADACCPEGYTGMRALEGCVAFNHCVLGVVTGTPVPCAPGTLFDPVARICNWADQVVCEIEPCEMPSSAPSESPIASPTMSPIAVVAPVATESSPVADPEGGSSGSSVMLASLFILLLALL